MSTAKASLFLVALVAGVALAQAAGGIKGQRADDSLARSQGLKGPRVQQQQYLPPPPPPPPQQLPLQPLPQAPRPVSIQQQIKGTGQVAPVFTAARVQPVIQQQQVIQQQEQEPEPQQQLVQQQQQQESEIDPSGAAQDSAPSLLAPAGAARAGAASAASEEEANPRPEPYAFNYAFESGDSATSGSSQREEQQDASGKVTGFYTLKGEDGRDRRVDYIADANGFRATISTNEMGTAAKDSADVDWQAQSPTDAQLRAAETATQAARERALQNPQPVQQQQQEARSGAASSLASASALPNKVSSPRQKSQQFASSRTQQQLQQQQIAAPAAAISQLQEPFEQIRQTELNARARKSRHAPFYLFTV